MLLSPKMLGWPKMLDCFFLSAAFLALGRGKEQEGAESILPGINGVCAKILCVMLKKNPWIMLPL